MGYDLHISRREFHAVESDHDITLAEWLAYIGSDDELAASTAYRVTLPGTNDTQPEPGFCEWLNHPDKTGDDKPWFDYSDGTISTKYPDVPTVLKMVRIAAQLGANVQGDDGERYDETHADTAAFRDDYRATSAVRKPWWKFW